MSLMNNADRLVEREQEHSFWLNICHCAPEQVARERGKVDRNAISIWNTEMNFFFLLSSLVHLRIDNRTWRWQEEKKKKKTHWRHNHLSIISLIRKFQSRVSVPFLDMNYSSRELLFRSLASECSTTIVLNRMLVCYSCWSFECISSALN